MAKPQPRGGWRIQAQLWVFTLLLAAGIGLILASELIFMPRVSVRAGQAASEDIAAPYRIEFVSELLTE